MTTQPNNLAKIHATLHYVTVNIDSSTDEEKESIFSIPAKVVEYLPERVTVEESKDNNPIPRRFTFLRILRPNGTKSWFWIGPKTTGVDDLELTLTFEEDYAV